MDGNLTLIALPAAHNKFIAPKNISFCQLSSGILIRIIFATTFVDINEIIIR